MISKRTLIKIFSAAAVVVFLVWINYRYINLSAEEIRSFVDKAGWFAPLLYIAIYAVRPFLLFPASILSLAGGLLFGVITGTILIVAGATIGAVLSFNTAKKLGRNIAEKEWSGHAGYLQAQLEENGFLYILLIRLIPLFNFDMISYLAGISKVKLKPFFLGTLTGIIPGAFAYSFLGASFAEGDASLILFAASLFVIVSVLPIIFRKKIFKKRNLSKGD